MLPVEPEPVEPLPFPAEVDPELDPLPETDHELAGFIFCQDVPGVVTSLLPLEELEGAFQLDPELWAPVDPELGPLPETDHELPGLDTCQILEGAITFR